MPAFFKTDKLRIYNVFMHDLGEVEGARKLRRAHFCGAEKRVQVHRHQRVLVESRRVEIFRVQVIGIATVGRADRPAEHPEQPDLAYGLVLSQKRQQRPAAHLLRDRQAVNVEKRRHQVHRLRQGLAPLAVWSQYFDTS